MRWLIVEENKNSHVKFVILKGTTKNFLFYVETLLFRQDARFTYVKYE